MVCEQLQGSSLETFLIIGKVSSEAVIKARLSENKSLACWLNVWLDEVVLEARIFTLQLALWLLHLKKALLW